MVFSKDQLIIQLEKSIHKVKDFPKEGVLFYDITGILKDPKSFTSLIDHYVERYKNNDLDAIVAIESRGFLFASPLAYLLKIPLVLIRKKRKLPRKTIQVSYTLEYGEDVLEICSGDIPRNGRVVLFDDLLATGGTAKAACELIRTQNGQIQELAAVAGLEFLPFKTHLKNVATYYIVGYSTESYETKNSM